MKSRNILDAARRRQAKKAAEPPVPVPGVDDVPLMPTPEPVYERGDAWEPPKPSANGRHAAPAEAGAKNGFVLAPIDSATFAAANYQREWLVRNVLVRGQPVVFGGPSKSLKTSIGIDLAISLGTGTDFLGRFPTRRTRVAFVSGESGPATLQESAKRIWPQRGVDLQHADIGWQFNLPKLADPGDRLELEEGLLKGGYEFVVLDPAYLCLLGGSVAGGPRAENLLEIGPLLLDVATSCLRAGATPCIVHHCRKGSGANYEPLELPDLAYGGFAEFARAWLLISRREHYEGDGVHRLWLNVGGSAGHGGVYAVDADEGQMADDFSGRRWDVSIRPASEYRAQSRSEREEEKSRTRIEKLDAEKEKVVAILRKLAEPQTRRQLREATGLADARLKDVLAGLVEVGAVAAVDVITKRGTGNKVESKGAGYAIASESDRGVFD